MRRIIVLAILVMGCAFLTPVDQSSQASAQKKKTGVAAEQGRAGKTDGSLRDVLAGLQGAQTNLGTLTRVGSDYVTFVHEGDTLYFSLHSLQGIKFLKTEEGEERKIEIHFLAKD